MDSLPLDSRKQQILKAVVSDYTETGTPVGSHALATKYLVSWSSATIRNELSSLVDIGYLLQPHTSAGRIPSDRGYRYYVDYLMREEALPPAVRRQLDAWAGDLPLVLEDLLEIAAQALAVSTDAVSIVTGPRALSTLIKHLDLVSLDPGHALLMLVFEGNIVRHQAMTLSAAADQESLSALAATLNRELRGLGAEEIAALPPRADAGEVHPLRGEIVDHITATMRAIDNRQDTLVVHDGVRNLLHQPEFGDMERLEKVLEVVEEGRILGEALAALDTSSGVRMVIGAENDLEQLRSCSLVLTTYRVGENRSGTMGVLGPTRMRYQQVAPRLRHLAMRLAETIERMLG